MKLLLSILAGGLIVVSYFAYFGFLDTAPIGIWDEARVAINSLGILEHNDWLVIHFDDQVELYNTKPILLNWIQAVFMYLIGPSDLSVRLPSALAACSTGGLLIYFCHIQFKSGLQGILSALLLAASSGFLAYHASRAADFDAMLTLCTTAYILAYFKYLQTRDTASAVVFFGALTAAIMTKGIAGVLPLPALVLFAFLSGQIQFLFKKPSFYLGTLVVVGIPALFYFLREQAAPGYLEATLNNDFGGRFLNPSDGHPGPWDFYISILHGRVFAPNYWFWLSIVGYFLWVFEDRNNWKKSPAVYLLIVTVWYFFILSAAATKLYWYIVPLYPLFALGAGYVFKKIALALFTGSRESAISTSAYVFALLAPAYISILPYINKPEGKEGFDHVNGRGFYAVSRLLKKQLNDNTLPPNTQVLYKAPNTHVFWYCKLAALQGKKIGLYQVSDSIKIGPTLIVDDTSNNNHLRQRMVLKESYAEPGVTVYETSPLIK